MVKYHMAIDADSGGNNLRSGKVKHFKKVDNLSDRGLSFPKKVG